MFGQKFYAPLSSLPQDCGSLFRGLKHYGAAVLLIHGAANQALRFQGVNDAAHSRWAHLLGPGQLIEGHCAAKDENRKRRQAWRREADGRILHSDLAQQMNGGAVQAVRQFFSFVQLAIYLALLTISLTRAALAFN